MNIITMPFYVFFIKQLLFSVNVNIDICIFIAMGATNYIDFD